MWPVLFWGLCHLKYFIPVLKKKFLFLLQGIQNKIVLSVRLSSSFFLALSLGFLRQLDENACFALSIQTLRNKIIFKEHILEKIAISNLVKINENIRHALYLSDEIIHY